MGGDYNNIKDIVGGSHGFCYSVGGVYVSYLCYNKSINFIMKKIGLRDRATMAILTFITCLGVWGLGFIPSIVISVLGFITTKGR